MHADRTNRIVLMLLGLLLTVAGVAGVLAGSGAFGSAVAQRTIADNDISRYAGDNGRWLWPAVAAVALIMALLVLRWLIAVLTSTDRVRVLLLHTGRTTDRTTLTAPAVADAVRGEIEGYHSVRSAKVWLIGNSAEPRLAINVDADREADLGALRDRIEHGALAHVRHALDRPDLPIRLDLGLTRRQSTRVV